MSDESTRSASIFLIAISANLRAINEYIGQQQAMIEAQHAALVTLEARISRLEQQSQQPEGRVH